MAIITRAQTETILVQRRGYALDRVKLSNAPTYTSATDSSPRSYLGDPIAYGVRSLDLTTVDPTNPTDTDLSAITAIQLDQLLDVAELRVLQSCLGNWMKFTQQAGTDKQQFTDLLTELRQQLAEQREHCKLAYGVGLMELTQGSIDLDLASQDDATSLAEIFN